MQLLLRIVGQKDGEEVIGQSLRLLLNNVVENEQLDTEILEH